MEHLKKYIRSVPDFPKPGINFYDITTLIQDPTGLAMALDRMQSFIAARKATKIVGIESRGFIFGAALADRLRISFVPARKSGKLPYKTVAQEYALEYGTARLEMHVDAIKEGDRCVIVDDLIATGGTLQATGHLIERLGGEVVGISALIALTFLPFEEKLSKYDIDYLLGYDAE